MKRKILFLLCFFNWFIIYSQNNNEFVVNIDSIEIKNDSIVILNVKIENNSQQDITIDNPDFYLIKSVYGNYFWIPPTWDLIIHNNENLLCIPEGRFDRISKSHKNIHRKMQKNDKLYFDIPININRLSCFSPDDKEEVLSNEFIYSFQLKITILKPKEVEIISNEVLLK